MNDLHVFDDGVLCGTARVGADGVLSVQLTRTLYIDRLTIEGVGALLAAAREEQREALGLDRWPTLIPFLAAMAGKLDANRAKKGGREGWQNQEPGSLVRRVIEEAEELEHAVDTKGAREILLEAADVANMAMMVADASGALDATPLTATPLADRIAELEQQGEVVRRELAAALERVDGATTDWVDLRADSDRMKDERDELRQRILDSCPSPDEGGRIHAGGRIVCGQCHDSEVSHLRAQIAEAVAAAREEQREADARAIEPSYSEACTRETDERWSKDREESFLERERAAEIIRATPLTATPLKDELESVRKHMSFIIQNCQNYMAQVETLRARVKELEEQEQIPEAARYWKREYDAEYARRLAVEDLSRTTCDRYLTDVGPVEHVLCCNKESSKRVASLTGERDALKAQLAEAVEVLRRLLKTHAPYNVNGDEVADRARAFLVKVKP